MLTFIRSVLFAVAFYVGTGLMAIAGLPVFLLGSQHAAMVYATAWSRFSLFILRELAGTRIEFRGRENIPPGAALIAAKHQSALETFGLLPLIPNATVIMKRELRHVPLFGRFTITAGMILIDRNKGAAALREIVARGREEAGKGRPILIFPEGTRRPAGAPPVYHSGVAFLYKALGLPVVPVALNSGLYWPRRSLLHYPGTVVIEFLPPIESGLDTRVFLARLEQAIETASDRLLAEAAAAADPPPLPATAQARLAALAHQP